ncbi:hypothetical protein HOY80DRAFT_122149 [Tuber brumale]|nr:hypothetical protein HOY80DRAFT_122149 [Tuber brumale]
MRGEREALQETSWVRLLGLPAQYCTSRHVTQTPDITLSPQRICIPVVWGSEHPLDKNSSPLIPSHPIPSHPIPPGDILVSQARKYPKTRIKEMPAYCSIVHVNESVRVCTQIQDISPPCLQILLAWDNHCGAKFRRGNQIPAIRIDPQETPSL